MYNSKTDGWKIKKNIYFYLLKDCLSESDFFSFFNNLKNKCFWGIDKVFIHFLSFKESVTLKMFQK